MSYEIGGYTALLPRSRIEPLDIPVEAAMRLVLTGGISGAAADGLLVRLKSGVGDAELFPGINQLDVADAGGAARDAPDGLYQAQEVAVPGARAARGIGFGDDEVQHGDALETVANVEDQADRPQLLAVALDGEQALGVRLPPTRTRSDLSSATISGAPKRLIAVSLSLRTRCWRR